MVEFRGVQERKSLDFSRGYQIQSHTSTVSPIGTVIVKLQIQYRVENGVRESLWESTISYIYHHVAFEHGKREREREGTGGGKIRREGNQLLSCTACDFVYGLPDLLSF